MKRGLCLIVIAGVFFLRLAAAAEAYSLDDYQSFCVMQRVADAHFNFVEHLNQRIRDKAKGERFSTTPGSYWLKDTRNVEPDPADTLAVKQGVLFNLKTCTLYSRFGAWCFASESMYKCALARCRSIIPQDNIWETFRIKFFKTYHVKLGRLHGSDDIYALRQFYGDALPPPELPGLDQGKNRLFFQGVFSWIGRWGMSQPVEQAGEMIDEMTSGLEMSRETSDRERSDEEPEFERLESQKHLLVIWHEMKKRYIEEQKGEERSEVQK